MQFHFTFKTEIKALRTFPVWTRRGSRRGTHRTPRWGSAFGRPQGVSSRLQLGKLGSQWEERWAPRLWGRHGKGASQDPTPGIAVGGITGKTNLLKSGANLKGWAHLKLKLQGWRGPVPLGPHLFITLPGVPKPPLRSPPSLALPLAPQKTRRSPLGSTPARG